MRASLRLLFTRAQATRLACCRRSPWDDIESNKRASSPNRLTTSMVPLEFALLTRGSWASAAGQRAVSHPKPQHKIAPLVLCDPGMLSSMVPLLLLRPSASVGPEGLGTQAKACEDGVTGAQVRGKDAQAHASQDRQFGQMEDAIGITHEDDEIGRASCRERVEKRGVRGS